jgi:enoyl-CoA hydratase
MLSELAACLDAIGSDDHFRAVVLTGSESVFCAGGDISMLASLGNPARAQRFVAFSRSVFARFQGLSRPIIAAVNGPALGGGCELALACDLRIAAQSATFGQPEIRHGILPGAGGTQRLPRLVGSARAKELLFSGDIIDAAEAHRIGLVNRVVPDVELAATALAWARKLAEMPQFALRLTKHAVDDGIGVALDTGLAIEARCFEMVFASRDQREGLSAFLEKRRPVFSGDYQIDGVHGEVAEVVVSQHDTVALSMVTDRSLDDAA